MSQFISNPDEAKEFWPRYNIFYAFLMGTLVVFTLRLMYLQIYSGRELREFSEKNRIKENRILAPRGLLLDRSGQILVENLPGFEVILSPQYIEDINELATTIAPILKIDTDKIVQKIIRGKKQNGVFSQIRLKDNLSRDEVLRLKRIQLDTPGLEIRESIVRYYPMNENGAQLYGYVAEISKTQLPNLNEKYKNKLKFNQGDIIGKSGLEEALELDIRGTDGLRFIQVDAHGRETITNTPNIYGEDIKDKDPIHGNNAVLTIDRDVQEAAYKSMKTLNRIGALVAMKPNGEVLAWVNEPSYDPNEFATAVSSTTWTKLINDPFKPLRNKVVQDHASPGSSFKPFVALAALEDKVITPTTVISAPGVFYYAKRPYHDSLKQGHGNVTIYEALEESSNVFFFKMGIALGIDKMYKYIQPFGLGQKTGVDLPREVSGLMPSPEWKKATYGEEWQGGENLSVAIGQGYVNTTPIQMAVAYNAIATEGKVVKPFVIRKILDQDGKVLKENFPQELRDLTQIQSTGIKISLENFKVVKEAMRRVANGQKGTARHWKIPGIQMAGKTGTAQVMGFSADQIYDKCESRPMHTRHHGWYAAWAPHDKPEIVVAFLAEHACHGNTGAAPVVRDVIQSYFQKYHPDMIAPVKKAATPKSSESVNTSEDD